MRATVRGEMRGVRPWEFDGKTGHTFKLEQDEDEVTISVPEGIAVATLPKKGAQVECEVDVLQPFHREGDDRRAKFRVRLVAIKEMSKV